jgi:hypothetical protein
MLLSLGICVSGLTSGSLFSLPYPDPPPPEAVAAAHEREQMGDMIALASALTFMVSLVYLYRRRHIL